MTTGNYNIMIGACSCASATGAGNQSVIGYRVEGSDNSLTFGNTATDSRIAYGATSITAPSDQRLKEEITDSTAGLDFINDLRPVTYKWKQEKDIPETMKGYVEDSTKRYKNEKVNHGFIAQEVKEVIDNHSELKDGFDMWQEETETVGKRQRLAEGALIPMLVKAIQELTKRIKELEDK